MNKHYHEKEEVGFIYKENIQKYIDKFVGMGTLLETLDCQEDQPFGPDTALYIVKTTTGTYAVRTTDGPPFHIDWDDLSPWNFDYEERRVKIKRYVPLKNPVVDKSLEEFGVVYENKYVYRKRYLVICIVETDSVEGIK